MARCGVDEPKEWAAEIARTAGSPRLALEYLEGLAKKAQRDGMGSTWSRVRAAGMETFFSWLFSPATALKVVHSGFITPSIDIAVTGMKEALVHPSRRILNAVAPEWVEAVSEASRGETWHKMQGFVGGVTAAWRSVHSLAEAQARVARAEGGIAMEQAFQKNLRESMPQYHEATQHFQYEPKMAGENFPDLPELVKKGIDIIGAVSRAPTLDLLGGAHGFTYTINDYMGAYAKAAEIAQSAGLTGEPYHDAVNRMMQERPDAVHKAGAEMGRHNTFLETASGDLGKAMSAAQNSLWKLFVMPVIKFPVNSFMFGAELMPGLQIISKRWRTEMWAGGGQRDTAVAKTALGFLVGVPLFGLASNGLITGGRPAGMLGEVFDSQGKKEYSMWVPGLEKWVSYRSLEPLGTWIGTMANLANVVREHDVDSIPGGIGALFYAAGREFLDKGLIGGFSRWLHAFESRDWDTFNRLATQQVSPPAPMGGTLRIIARQYDNVRREAHTLSERWQATLPGYSEGVPAHTNIITGENLLHEGLFGAGLSSFIATATPHDHPVLTELARLKGAGLTSLPDHIAGPRNAKTGEVPSVPLTGEQKYRWGQIMTKEFTPEGKTLEAAMVDLTSSPLYTAQSDETKTSLVHGVWNGYKLGAQEKLLEEVPALRQAATAAGVERMIRRLPPPQQGSARDRLLSTLAR